MSTEILNAIQEAWGWTGFEPANLLQENDFGNLLIEDQTGVVWRLCPEELTCKSVALTPHDYKNLLRDPEFIEDWEMLKLVELARLKLGSLTVGRKYCLKIPAVLGGTYGSENISTAPLGEIIRFSGDIAKQIKDLPDGATINLKIKK